MGYTHGYTLEDEFRICSSCGRKLPQTEEYYYWQKKGIQFQSQCKECKLERSKERNNEQKNKKNIINRPEYKGTKECICCHRQLPNNWMYFPTDKTCITGLRNKCRECTPNYGKFLSEDSIIFEKWSDKDIQLMKDNYALYTGKELQEKFFPNRSVRAIESEASVLGIRGKNEETKERANLYRSNLISDTLTGRTKNAEWRQKISNTKREYFKTHDGWWKGKQRSEKQRNQISESMKGNWAGNKNPRHINPLNGSNNGRWKGGINKTYFELRSDTKIWQQESMAFCNYHCVITGKEFDNVHHIVPFRDIVDQAFMISHIPVKEKVQDYSLEEFELLRNIVIDLHREYGYGVCINKKVHKLFHDEYGYTKTTCQDFLDFIKKIEEHKYDDWFKSNNLEININYDFISYLKNLKIKEIKETR